MFAVYILPFPGTMLALVITIPTSSSYPVQTTIAIAIASFPEAEELGEEGVKKCWSSDPVYQKQTGKGCMKTRLAMHSSHSNLNLSCFCITFYFNPCVLSLHSDIHHSSTKYIEIEHYSVEYFDCVGACIPGKSIQQHI